MPRIPTKAVLSAIIEKVVGQREFDSDFDQALELTDWEQIQVSSLLVAVGIEAPLSLWSGDETRRSLYDKVVAHNLGYSARGIV
jgi:hypothetical protein